MRWTILTDNGDLFNPRDLDCSIESREGNTMSGVCSVDESTFASLFPIKAKFPDYFGTQSPSTEEPRQAPTFIELSGFMGPGLWGKRKKQKHAHTCCWLQM